MTMLADDAGQPSIGAWFNGLSLSREFEVSVH